MHEPADLVLKANQRNMFKKQLPDLRQNGQVPGIVYGHGQASQPVAVALKELTDVYTQSGDSSLVNLVVENNAPVQVLIQDISYNHLTDAIEHVDFYAVNMSEAITAELALNFTGVAPAVKELGGVLLKNKTHIAIKCLPQNLIKEYTVDISPLKTFADEITIKDLKLPETIEVLDKPNDTVVLVTPPRSDEELAELNQTVKEDVSTVAGVTKETDDTATETTPQETKTK